MKNRKKMCWVKLLIRDNEYVCCLPLISESFKTPADKEVNPEMKQEPSKERI